MSIEKVKKSKIIIIISIIFLIIPGIIYFIWSSGEGRRNEELNKYIEQIVVNNNYFTWDEEQIENVYKSAENISNETGNSETKGKADYVMGYINSMNPRNEETSFDQIYQAKELLEETEDSTDTMYKTAKAAVYYQLSVMYLDRKKEEESKEYFEKCMHICRESSDSSLEIKFTLNRAQDLYAKNTNNIEEAIKLTEDCAVFAKNENYSNLYDIYRQIAVFYEMKSSPVQAVNYQVKALELLNANEISKDDSKYVQVLDMTNELAGFYLNLREYDNCIEKANTVYNDSVTDNKKNEYIKLDAALILFHAYLEKGENDSAEEYFNEAEKIFNSAEKSQDNEDRYTKLLQLYADLKAREGSGPEALEIMSEVKDRYGDGTSFLFFNFDINIIETTGDAYYASGDYDKSLELHLKALERVLDMKMESELDNYYEKVEKDYEALGDTENTIKYLKLCKDAKNKQLMNNANESSNYLLKEFETQEKTDLIENLAKDKKVSLIIIAVCAAAIIMMFIGSVILFNKTSKMKKLNKKLENISDTDPLTKLYNRRALENYLEDMWNENNIIPVTFIMIDIDYFKKYNDNYGHPAGDEVLKKVASVIKSECSEEDFVARYGGEEFIAILKNVGENVSASTASRIRNALKKADILHEYSEVTDEETGEKVNRVTISMGGFTANSKLPEPKTMIDRADEALYFSKENGRNRFTHFKDVRSYYEEPKHEHKKIKVISMDF